MFSGTEIQFLPCFVEGGGVGVGEEACDYLDGLLHRFSTERGLRLEILVQGDTAKSVDCWTSLHGKKLGPDGVKPTGAFDNPKKVKFGSPMTCLAGLRAVVSSHGPRRHSLPRAPTL
jgi:hypothetical protein